MNKVKPDEVYHLAAQSYVDYSFDDEFSTLNSNINGTHYILSAVKEFSQHSKFYFAGSSEMFGKAKVSPQDENTPFHPRSAYGISKVAGYHLTQNYREAYNIFASNGILFNHESPLRGETFVSRKITRAAARISLGIQNKLKLGNLNAKRDWGHAKDYVETMWLILQHKIPDDWVISTGLNFSVRDFTIKAFEKLDIKLKFQGNGLNEVGIIDEISQKSKLKKGDIVVEVDPDYFRPSEVENLLGDSSKAKANLGWEPKITFQELVTEMMEHDFNQAKRDSLIKEYGYKIFDYHE